jgi:hypothetical protein
VTKLDVDLSAVELFIKAEYSSDGAVKLLQYIAHKLRDRQPLAGDIRDFLADALEATKDKTGKQAQRALGEALHLTTAHRRKKVDWIEVGERVEELMRQDGKTENFAIDDAAGEFEIDQKSVRTALKTYRVAKKADQDDQPSDV